MVIRPREIIIGALIGFIYYLLKRLSQQQQQVVVNSREVNKKMKRICPKCSWQNDMDNKFCVNCGYKFGNK
jgi:ribosomal protein L40E